MKQSTFITKVLKSKKNTVFVNREQVLNAIEVFQKLGMLPPSVKIDGLKTIDIVCNLWEYDGQ